MYQPELGLLEVHLSDQCNLRCIGCTSFSDYLVKNSQSWQDTTVALEKWARRIKIKGIGIGGGEPTMNPEIIQAIIDMRRIFPDSMIDLVTNGTYLIKKPQIVDTLKEIGHSVLTVSFHEPTKQYSQKVKDFLLTRYRWRESTVSGWLETDNYFHLNLRDAAQFMTPVRGTYGQVKPHHSDPAEAFSICCFGNSFNLFQGNLYKCGPLQYLPRMLQDWAQSQDSDWQFYLNYRSLSPDCTDQELMDFFSTVDSHEPYCSMCPGKNDRSADRKVRGQWPSIKISPHGSIK